MPTEVLARPIELAARKKDPSSPLIASIFTLIFAIALVAAFVHPAPPPADGEILVSGP